MECDTWIISEILVAHRGLLIRALLLLHCQLREIEHVAPMETKIAGWLAQPPSLKKGKKENSVWEEGGLGLGNYTAL